MKNNRTDFRFTRFLTIFAAVLVLIFSSQAANAQTKGKAKAAAKTHVVQIRGSAFTPASMTINVGDSVVWNNKDIIPHTATGKSFDSGNMDVGASYKFVFKKKGTYSYTCSYHPTMHGTIVVK